MEDITETKPVLVFDHNKGIYNFCKYYTDNLVRTYPISKGDRITIKSTEEVVVGEKYRTYPARVIEIFYTSKKWWQFWKKKRQLGFKIEWEE